MVPSTLTPKQFTEWRKNLGMSQQAASQALGISTSSVTMYEQGRRKEGEVKIPVLVALGMSAIKAGLTPYKGEDNVNSIQDSSESKD